MSANNKASSSLELLLIAYVISTIFLCAGSNIDIFYKKKKNNKKTKKKKTTKKQKKTTTTNKQTEKHGL